MAEVVTGAGGCPRVLVVDDDPGIRRVLEAALRVRGHEVVVAANGMDGVGLAAAETPDVVILDLGLPDIDGVDVCRSIRRFSDVPIIVLSIQEDEGRKVQALDEGAHDYVTKPFGMAELLARIRVALRRRDDDVADQPVLRAGPVEIDLVAHRCRLNGAELRVTGIEFRLLAELARHPGRVLTHEMLLGAVWGDRYSGERHYLRVYVNRLRRKLEADPSAPQLLITVPGVGYRLDGDGEDASASNRGL